MIRSGSLHIARFRTLLAARRSVGRSAVSIVVVGGTIRVGVVVRAVAGLVSANETHVNRLNSRVGVVVRVLVRSSRAEVAVAVVVALAVGARARG